MSTAINKSSGEIQRNVYVCLIALVVAIGGFLFGYDTAVVSGAIGFLQEHFNLGPAAKGWAASSALIGCIIGAAVAGTLSDRFGRKKILLLTGLLFAVSAITSAIPRTLGQFITARIIGGIGVGAASMLVPLYIAEVSPAAIRGRLVSLQQLAVVVGIVIVYFANMIIQSIGNESWNIMYGWRWMFGSETIPAMLYFFLLLLVPESPRWLTKQGYEDKAFGVLSRIGGPKVAQEELADIREAVKLEGESIWQVFKPRMNIALTIAVILAILQQVTGITAVIYYAPEIFKSAGASTNSAFIQTVAIGAVNLMFTFVAIFAIDKLGRKMLMLIGSAGTGFSLLVIARAFQTESFGGPWMLIAILGYIAAFAMSLGPVVWVIVSELFPTRIRGRAMAIATFSLWVAAYLVSQTFPMLLEALGTAKTFYLYATTCAITFVFVWRVVPETKGRTLEEIEQWWAPKSTI
jgi:sugar porter (SP) family MFS transporter